MVRITGFWRLYYRFDYTTSHLLHTYPIVYILTFTAHKYGCSKKCETKNPNREPDIRTESSGTRTKLINFFDSGTQTDIFFGLSVRVRVDSLIKRVPENPRLFFFLPKINRLIFIFQIGNNNVILCGIMYIGILFFGLKYK